MGNNENLELLLKQLSRNFIKKQLEQLKNNKISENNSSIYLESDTLNMLILSLLIHMEAKNKGEPFEYKGNELYCTDFLKELDLMIKKNRKEFEDIINLLSEK